MTETTDYEKVFTSQPVNKSSAIVVSQSGVSESVLLEGKDQISILEERRREVMNRVCLSKKSRNKAKRDLIKINEDIQKIRGAVEKDYNRSERLKKIAKDKNTLFVYAAKSVLPDALLHQIRLEMDRIESEAQND